MKNPTAKDIEYVKELIFSDTPELAYEMLTNWDKTLVKDHFRIESGMFPFLCLQHLPFLLEGCDKLNLESRRLVTVPTHIGKLQYLRTLLLRGNKLRSLPTEVVQLTHLSHLDLSHNLFEAFPREICELKNLYTLNLEHNELKRIPAGIGHLTKLISLDLNDNQIIYLPEEMRQLTQLKSLEIIHNPIPPSEIVKLKRWLPGCDIRHS